MPQIDWKPFVEIVQENQRYILTSHIRPDCDALGSELGLALILETLGKEVRIINGQATPPNLSFIDPDDRIQAIGDTVTADQARDADVHIVLDTSAWAQIGPMSEVFQSTRARKLVIDHHIGDDELGAELFKDVTAEATGRLIVEAADALSVPLTPAIANPLFAAMATDTGWFRFGSTNGDTYRAAGRLLDAGADQTKIYNSLYEQDSVGRVRLRGLILARTQTELDGRLAHTYVRKDDYAAAKALPTDTEDVINMTLGIAGTEVAAIVVEQPTGGFKLSFRSRCDVDCSQLASQFGGGGHKAAAGAFVDLPFETAQQRVLQAIRSAMAG